MKKNTPHLLLLLIIAGASCREAAHQPLASTPVDVVDLRLNESPVKKEFFKSLKNVHFVHLETSDSTLVAEVSKIIETQDRLLIVDRRKRVVHVYDTTGHYLYKIGNVGRGPGEYMDVTDCYYERKTNHVFVCSNESGLLLEYTIDGQLVSSRKLNFFPSQFVRRGNDFVFFTNNNFSDESGLNNLLILDSTFKIRKRFFPVDRNPDGTYGFAGFVFNGNDHEILYNNALSDTIYSISPSDTIYPKYHINFGNYSVPADVRSDFSKFMRKGLEYSFLRNNILESDSIMMFSYLHDRHIYFGFLNMQNQALLTGREFSESAFATKMRPPVGMIGGSFVSALDLGTLVKDVEKDAGLKNEIETHFPELNALLSKAAPSDNPILIKYQVSF